MVPEPAAGDAGADPVKDVGAPDAVPIGAASAAIKAKATEMAARRDQHTRDIPPTSWDRKRLLIVFHLPGGSKTPPEDDS